MQLMFKHNGYTLPVIVDLSPNLFKIRAINYENSD